MSSTRVNRRIDAPRSRVYRALLDARAIATWRVPTGMTSRVHAFEAREGGTFRVSLTYEAPTGMGKTKSNTDTYHGRFVKLVPNELVVEALEFETTNSALLGEMTITTTLTDADGGTEISSLHEGLPKGVSTADNEAGSRDAFAKLAALVEGGFGAPDPKLVVLRFNEAINVGDLEALTALMTHDHHFIDADGQTTSGRAAMRKAWQGFFTAFPDYRNDFTTLSSRGATVFVIGRSLCSARELDGPALWSAVVRGELVAEWRVFTDTDETRRALGLANDALRQT